MKKITEEKIQSDFVIRCNRELPMTRKLIFHVQNEIPNDNKFIFDWLFIKFGALPIFQALKKEIDQRTKMFASNNAAKGIVKGVPDIIFIWKGRVYPIEFKTPDGRLHGDQPIIHEVWGKNGAPVMLCRDSETAFNYVKSIVESTEN